MNYDSHPPLARGALGAWWWQGFRSALLMRPDWRLPPATPTLLAWLALTLLAAGILIERVCIVGPATFYWPSLLSGWIGLLVAAWVGWLLVPHGGESTVGTPVNAAALFAMLASQGLALSIMSGLVYAPLIQYDWFFSPKAQWGAWGVMISLLGWACAAQIRLVWCSGQRRTAPRLVASAALAGVLLLQAQWRGPSHWYPAPPSTQAGQTASDTEPLALTQDLLELQPQLLQSKLREIGSGRPGRVDMYAITFAPYASDSVFQRESELVATVMQQRFATVGKTLQLVNHKSTARQWPWATPLNLQRTIQRMAQVMNRDEDILFIHLTSHGARDGRLSAEFWPLTIDEVTPSMLKAWLDEAGIRWRVISVSACYSGSWIEPLADPGTLLMTAADADHTSYGCGNGSALTYFGRAMYDEELRRSRSFEQAHAAARLVIDRREKEA